MHSCVTTNCVTDNQKKYTCNFPSIPGNSGVLGKPGIQNHPTTHTSPTNAQHTNHYLPHQSLPPSTNTRNLCYKNWQCGWKNTYFSEISSTVVMEVPWKLFLGGTSSAVSGFLQKCVLLTEDELTTSTKERHWRIPNTLSHCYELRFNLSASSQLSYWTDNFRTLNSQESTIPLTKPLTRHGTLSSSPVQSRV